MTTINEADTLRLGTEVVDRAYLGADLVWPSGFVPSSLAGLTVWVDASQLGLADGAALSSWPNLGSGGVGAVVGSPAPKLRAGALKGLPVVRFQASEGRVRGTGMCVDGSYDLTVAYVARQWGPNVGRIFTNTYPPYNFLVGTHTVGEPRMYDNGWCDLGAGWSGIPTPWKLYGCVCSGTPRVSEFYVNGALLASGGSSAGHDNRWNLSGYAATEETCDCEVAELVAYNRPLSVAERQQVEAYLTGKWL